MTSLILVRTGLILQLEAIWLTVVPTTLTSMTTGLARTVCAHTVRFCQNAHTKYLGMLLLADWKMPPESRELFSWWLLFHRSFASAAFAAVAGACAIKHVERRTTKLNR